MISKAMSAKYVLVAVSADPSQDLLSLVAAPILSAGLTPAAAAKQLSETAAEILFEVDTADALAQVRRALSEFPADAALLPADNRRKRLLICDMDSTIIEQECLDELADYAGLKNEISAITERAMRGELEFDEALITRVSKLKGLSLSAIDACYSDRITLSPGAKTLVHTMASHGATCLLVSGGFTAFTNRIASAVGFHSHHANTLLDEGDTLTGEVARPILGREAKLETLNAAATRLGLKPADALVIGDGANDLAMIEAAGLGVAYRAKPIVAERADAAINVTDLTSALYFQGYSAEEIIAA